MWGPGFRYGTPWPRFWDIDNLDASEDTPAGWLEDSYFDFNPFSPQNVLQIYDWIYPTLGTLSRAIFIRWKVGLFGTFFGWHVLERAVTGHPDTKILEFGLYKVWPLNVNPGDYVVEIEMFINVTNDGPTPWGASYRGRARPDDWVPD